MNEFSLNNFKYRFQQFDNLNASLVSGNYIDLDDYISKKNGYNYINSIRDYSESGNFVYIGDVNSSRFLDDIFSSGFHHIKNEVINKLIYYPDLTYSTNHKFSLSKASLFLNFNNTRDKRYDDSVYRNYYNLLSYDENGENLELITNYPDIITGNKNPNYYINSPIYLFESNYHELNSLEYLEYSKSFSIFNASSGVLIKNITDLKHINKIYQNDKNIYMAGLSTDYDILSDNYYSYNTCEYLITRQYDLLSHSSGKIQYQNLFNNYQNNFEITIKHDSVSKIAGQFNSGYFDLFFLARDITSKNILEYIPPGYLRANLSTNSELFDNTRISFPSYGNNTIDDIDCYSFGLTSLFKHKGYFWNETYYYKNIEQINNQSSGIIRIECSDSTYDIKQKISNAIGYEPEIFGSLDDGEIFIISKGIMDYSNYYNMMKMEDFNFKIRELQFYSYNHYNHTKGDIVTYGCITPSGEKVWMNRHGSNTMYNYHNQSGDYYTVTPNRLGEIYSIAESNDSGVIIFGGNLVKEYETRTMGSGTLTPLLLTSDLGYYSDFRHPSSMYNIPNEESASCKLESKYSIRNIYDMQNVISDIKCLKHNSFISNSILYHSGTLNITFPNFTNSLEASGY